MGVAASLLDVAMEMRVEIWVERNEVIKVLGVLAWKMNIQGSIKCLNFEQIVVDDRAQGVARHYTTVTLIYLGFLHLLYFFLHDQHHPQLPGNANNVSTMHCCKQ